MDLNPHSSNAWTLAQISVIGSLLIDPEPCAGLIFQRARSEQFSDASLRHVFEAARGLWNENRKLDAVTILDAAGSQYEELLASCMQQTPTAANVSDYLDILQRSARLDALRGAAYEILNAHSDTEAAAIYERMGQALRDTEDVEDLSWSECVHDYLDRMGDKTPVDRLRWGIEQLDSRLSVTPGKFVILAADSSVGKTALALQFAYHMASTGKRVGFFSLETDKESLTDRLMAEAQVAGINMPRTKEKALSDRDWRAASAAGDRSTGIPLRILRRAETIEQIRSRTISRRFDVIFIDYVQLIDAPGRERWDIVTNVSIGLHRMAQQLGVTVIGLSQITPASKDAKKAPSKDDLRESRQLKHDADVILIMSLSQEGAGVFRELQIAKNKDGPLGRMLLSFDAEHMSFAYREPPKPNPFAEMGKLQKKKKYTATPGQETFRELGEQEGGPLPF